MQTKRAQVKAMKKLFPLFLLFLIVSLSLPLFIPKIEGQILNDYWINLELDQVYGFRGEQINITAQTNHENVTVLIYDPLETLVYNNTWIANETRTIPISQTALFGEYRINGLITNKTQEKWFNVVDKENFQSVTFPFIRSHKGIEYSVFANKTLIMNVENQKLSVHLPDLPSGVTVNCFNNSDIFVARFKSGVIDIDLSLVFVRQGAKLVINGTSDSQKDFKFKFYSPKQIKKFAQKIELLRENVVGNDPNALIFDWSDFVKAKEHLEYNHTTHTLTVKNVPQTFKLDPMFGKDDIGGTTDWSPGPNYIWGTKFTLSEAGDITNIGCYLFGTGTAKCMIYVDSSGYPGAYKTVSSEVSLPSGWNWVDFSTSVSLTADDYWLFSWVKDGAGDMKYDAGSTNQSCSKWRAYGTPPDPFPSGAAFYDREYSIYANYTVAGEFTYTLQETFNFSSSMNQYKEKLYTQTQTVNFSESLIWGKEKLFTTSNIFQASWNLIVQQEKLFLGTQTFSTTTQLDFGKTFLIEILETFQISSILEVYQEKLFTFEQPTIVNSYMSFSVETMIVIVEVLETFHITDAMTLTIQEVVVPITGLGIAIIALIFSIFAIILALGSKQY